MYLMYALLLPLLAHATPAPVLAITNADGRPVATAVLLDAFTALTAAHTVGPEHTVAFVKCGDADMAGVVSRKGPVHDLALVTLYTPCRAVDPVRLESVEPEQGEEVSIVGYPAGKFATTKGTVQGTRMFAVRKRTLGGGIFWVAMVLKAQVRPGNSGGPVLSKNGKLVGIVHGFHETLEGKPGVAVPLSAITQFIQPPASFYED